jgi:hypothetical protein
VIYVTLLLLLLSYVCSGVALPLFSNLIGASFAVYILAAIKATAVCNMLPFFGVLLLLLLLLVVPCLCAGVSVP